MAQRSTLLGSIPGIDTSGAERGRRQAYHVDNITTSDNHTPAHKKRYMSTKHHCSTIKQTHHSCCCSGGILGEAPYPPATTKGFDDGPAVISILLCCSFCTSQKCSTRRLLLLMLVHPDNTIDTNVSAPHNVHGPSSRTPPFIP